MKHWTSSFDPMTYTLSLALVWVRILTFPLHFWGLSSLCAIRNYLGKFHYKSEEIENYSITTYACICVEMEFNKGFPTKIILTSENSSWSQKLDYKNVSVSCRVCFEIGHKETHCQKIARQAKKHLCKSTWWVSDKEEHQRLERSRYMSYIFPWMKPNQNQKKLGTLFPKKNMWIHMILWKRKSPQVWTRKHPKSMMWQHRIW